MHPALLARLDAQNPFFEFQTGSVLGADDEIAFLVLLAYNRQPALVEPLQVGDQNIASFQGALHRTLGCLASLDFLQLLLNLFFGRFVDHFSDLEVLVLLHFDFGPDIQDGGERERLTGLVIQLVDSGRCRRHQSVLARGFFQQARQQIVDNLAADRIAVAPSDHVQRHLAFAEARNLQTFLVVLAGPGELGFDPLCRHLDF